MFQFPAVRRPPRYPPVGKPGPEVRSPHTRGLRPGLRSRFQGACGVVPLWPRGCGRITVGNRVERPFPRPVCLREPFQGANAGPLTNVWPFGSNVSPVSNRRSLVRRSAVTVHDVPHLSHATAFGGSGASDGSNVSCPHGGLSRPPGAEDVRSQNPFVFNRPGYTEILATAVVCEEQTVYTRDDEPVTVEQGDGPDLLDVPGGTIYSRGGWDPRRSYRSSRSSRVNSASYSAVTWVAE